MHLIIYRILKSFVERINRVWLHSDILFNFTQLSKDFYDNIKYNHNFTDNVRKKFILHCLKNNFFMLFKTLKLYYYFQPYTFKYEKVKNLCRRKSHAYPDLTVNLKIYK